MTIFAVVVELKDGGLLKRLENLQKNGVALNGTFAKAESNSPIGELTKESKSQTGIFKRLQDLSSMQLFKFVGMGVGIGTIAAATIKSSGLLQGMFKLWETSTMILLRPMADFIALALRPITYALLTQFILPFYKDVHPVFRIYGKQMGKALEYFAKLAGFDPEKEKKQQQFDRDLATYNALKTAAPGTAEAFWRQRYGTAMPLTPGVNAPVIAPGAAAIPPPQILTNWPQMLWSAFTNPSNWVTPGSPLDSFMKMIGGGAAAPPSSAPSLSPTTGGANARDMATYNALLKSSPSTAAWFRKTKGFAQGGVLGEDIIGFGLQTGMPHLMHKNETITPPGKSGNTFNVNINVNGKPDSGTIFEMKHKLRTTIQAIADTL